MKNRRIKARVSAIVCVAVLLAWAPACWAAGNWDAPATELARQIAGLTGPGAVSLTMRNNSAIENEEPPAIRRLLVTALNALGVTIQPGSEAATAVRVTLSQSARQGVWVAEVQQGPQLRVAMVSLAIATPAAQPRGTLVTLRKSPIFTQAEPILDAELIELPGDSPSAPHLAVLSPETMGLYRGGAVPGQWVKQQSVAIPHDRPYPRDVRGRIETEAAGTFKAYLPGVVCSGLPSAGALSASDGLAVSCADSDDPWPIGARAAFYNSGRNYFTGVVIPSAGADSAPFYSAAELAGKRGALTVYSEVGGQVRVADASGLKPLAGTRDWGSDVAGVQSGCGAGAQLIATASGDAMQDSLLAYEVDGREAIAVSPPLPIDGEVVALWRASSSSVTMIVKREQPLQYEAYSVSAVCTP